ncbi:MAG TPA: hypothetical protein VFV19_06575 [Candidatus Polarisedimenticolaceae bacterium]|nr:hypothetical protein [Candidatus Polarisedimenticolaceae bacterium]
MERLRPTLEALNPGPAVLALAAVEIGQAAARFDARPPAGFFTRLLVDLAAIAAALAVGALERGLARLEDPPGARESFVLAAAAGAAAAVLGLALGLVAGAAALGYGFVALLLGVWRRSPAVGADALGRGLGESAAIAALGPACVLCGYAAQAGEGSLGAFYAGLPVGLSAAAALYAGGTAGLLLPLAAAAAILLVRSLGEAAHGAWPACLPLVALAGLVAWRRATAEKLALGFVIAADLILMLAYRLGGSP